MWSSRIKSCAVGLLLAVAALVSACDPDEEPNDRTAGGVILLDVKVPRLLTSEARDGRKFYIQFCAECHGRSIGGTKSGPPLIEYGSSHHSDESFHQAVTSGVKQHHWKYGDMPAVKGITSAEVNKIISFVREVQRYDEAQGRAEDEW